MILAVKKVRYLNNIKVMSEVLANQIAAGEVVERPSSVVKELVENAIDAGSTSIIIEIVEAGIQQIKVTDNGSGILSGDLELAVTPHATSKIFTKDDLFKIATLGFRGEALASIASISEVKIETCHDSESIGRYILYKGSKLIDDGFSQINKGTTITVNHLFYNTPARLKHLKTLNTELKHILTFVQNIALAYPSIKFSLYSDSQLVFQSVGNYDLQQAIASVYQPKIARELISISGKNFEFELEGYISNPTLTRTSQNYIHWIINGRSVRSRVLSEVLIRSYGRRLMVGRYPIAVIHVNLDPRLVDVNVHPTKQIVRLSKEEELSNLITEIVSTKLMSINPVPSIDHTNNSKINSINKDTIKNLKQSQFNFEYLPNQTNQNTVDLTTYASGKTSNIMNEANFIEEQENLELISKDNLSSVRNDNETQCQLLNFLSMRYIGQLHGTYLITESEDGFYLIDQHAAQEKIRYEKFMSEDFDVEIQQQLLLPEIISVTKEQMVKIEMLQSELQNIGIFLSQFGPSSYQIESYPQWLTFDDLESSIIDIIEFIDRNPKAKIQDIIEKSLISKSCKGAIKANHHLDDSEAIQLIQDLADLKDPFHCPHGRPILVHISDKELEKWFKRIQDSHQSQYDSQFYD